MSEQQWQIVLGGTGGQGLIVAGVTLAKAAVREGKNAVQTQTYGIQTRGGYSQAEVVISDGPIYFPKCDEPDLVLALSQAAYDRYFSNVSGECIILYDVDTVKSSGRRRDAGYPFTAKALELGNERVINSLALGCVIKICRLVSKENLIYVLQKELPPGVFSLNLKALELAYLEMPDHDGTGEIMARGQEALMNTYNRFPMALTKGEGVWVWDLDGKRYIDFVTGIAVTSLGHSHPAVVETIRKQAGELVHTSNLYWIPNQVSLAERLIKNSFADKVFFGNSGGEANEGAFKLARKYAKKNHGPDKFEVVSLKNSFHGRTLATLTATGQDKYHEGYEPLPTGFSYVPSNDLQALEAAVTDHTAAVLLEPIQGEGGIHPASDEFLRKAREVCDRHHALLIFDEVQCGIGRTGKLFAYEWSSVTPDIMTLGKALAGGIPVGAVLATNKVAEAFRPGDHGTTIGGNPLAMAVGCAVLDVMLADGFLAGVREKAEYLRIGLDKLAEAYHLTGPVRGRGMMLGLDVGEKGPQIVDICREHGLLLNCVGGKTFRFLPPLTVDKSALDEALTILDSAMAVVLS